MKLSEFNYSLPSSLIATYPADPRDAARLLVFNRKTNTFSDSHFYDLPDFLQKGDVLVFNDSKVIPARLHGLSETRKFEVLLVKKGEDRVWETWIKPGRKARIGAEFVFTDRLKAKLVKRDDQIFFFDFNLSGQEFFAEIEQIGEMPVPPYILKARQEDKGKKEDLNDYQTVYAKEKGSVAAPTAGLHFTEELLERLMVRGVQTEKVTLHVGLGTFQPVNTDNVEDFCIHSEYYEISPDTAKRLNQAKKEGRRIIAVGTTSVRVLESAATNVDACGLTGCGQEYLLLPKSGETNIYIYPGYQFKFIDGMITNFHLPKSSLLLLVAAFIGKDQMQKLYKHAICEKYMFYSYGDGTLLF
jgi:S-adenosylmethionine:tRNA ribosyltransferase-isomerase